MPGSPGCETFAFITHLCIMINIVGAMFVALYATHRLVLSPLSAPYLGEQDWVVLLIIYGLPLLFTAFGPLASGALGVTPYWCLIKGDKVEWGPIFLTAPLLTGMVCNGLCNRVIAYKLSRVAVAITNKATAATLVDFVRELNTYVLIYVFAFCPFAVLTILYTQVVPRRCNRHCSSALQPSLLLCAATVTAPLRC